MRGLCSHSGQGPGFFWNQSPLWSPESTSGFSERSSSLTQSPRLTEAEQKLFEAVHGAKSCQAVKEQLIHVKSFILRVYQEEEVRALQWLMMTLEGRVRKSPVLHRIIMEASVTSWCLIRPGEALEHPYLEHQPLCGEESAVFQSGK